MGLMIPRYLSERIRYQIALEHGHEPSKSGFFSTIQHSVGEKGRASELSLLRGSDPRGRAGHFELVYLYLATVRPNGEAMPLLIGAQPGLAGFSGGSWARASDLGLIWNRGCRKQCVTMGRPWRRHFLESVGVVKRRSGYTSCPCSPPLLIRRSVTPDIPHLVQLLGISPARRPRLGGIGVPLPHLAYFRGGARGQALPDPFSATPDRPGPVEASHLAKDPHQLLLGSGSPSALCNGGRCQPVVHPPLTGPAHLALTERPIVITHG